MFGSIPRFVMENSLTLKKGKYCTYKIQWAHSTVTRGVQKKVSFGFGAIWEGPNLALLTSPRVRFGTSKSFGRDLGFLILNLNVFPLYSVGHSSQRQNHVGYNMGDWGEEVEGKDSKFDV